MLILASVWSSNDATTAGRAAEDRLPRAPAVGEKRDEFRQSLESGPGVAEVVPILAPYKVASREVKPEPTVVRAGSLVVGNCHLGMIAGPCSVEGEEQTMVTARAVSTYGRCRRPSTPSSSTSSRSA